MKRFLVVCGILALATTGITKEKGETSAPFLKIAPGARPAALGEAFTGVADDATACYWNPAGLAQLKMNEGMFMFLRPMMEAEGLNMSYIATAIPAPYGVFGGALTYFGYGKEDEVIGTDDDDNPITTGKEWTAYDLAVSCSFARNIDEKTSAGGTLKIVNGKIADKSAIAFAVDLGVLYILKEKIKIGAVLKNLGTEMKYVNEGFGLPLCVKVGVAYYEDTRLPIPILGVADITISNDNRYFGGGIEARIKEVFRVRAGYKTGPQEIGSGITIGCGTSYLLYNFDYAYQDFGDLGSSHRVSVSVKF